MPEDSTSFPVFDSAVLNLLACPACLGALRPEEARLVCEACGREYPVVEGIAALVGGRDAERQG
jgi:uncharacterized protein YbaR (Trm112 family)